jgi:hypothetical protein
MCIPLIFIVVMIFINFLFLLVKKKKNIDLNISQLMLSRSLQFLVLFLMTLYAFLVSNAASPFKCNFESSMSMIDAPSVQCFDKQWWEFFPIVICFMLLYAIILPTTVLWFLVKNPKWLIFSSLTSSYKEKFYWWELVLILKKMIFTFSVSILRSLQWQDCSLFMTSTLLCFYQIAQAAFLPFKEHRSFTLSLS